MRSSMPYRSLLLLALALSAPLAARPAFAPMDVFALQWAESPAVAPDGRSAIYQRSFFDRQKDQRRSNLWWIDLRSGEQRPLTTGDRNDAGVAWSPDGRRIAFVGSDGGRSQIFVRWLDSGATARLTQLERSPGALVWSPDGKRIAFTQRVSAQTTTLAKDMPRPPSGAKWADPVKVIDTFRFRFDGAGFIEPGYSHVFVVDAEGGAPRQVTRGDFDFSGPLSFSPDGESLYLSANPVEDADHDPIESDLYRVEVATGKLHRLTDRDGPDARPMLSPDGKSLAYVGFDDQRLGYQNSVLSVLDLASGESRALTGSLDRSIEQIGWDGDRGLYFSYDDHGVTRIGWVARRGGKLEQVASDLGGTAMGRPYDGGSFDVASGQVLYTHSTPYRPADLAVVSRGRDPRVLTALNDTLLDGRELGRVETLEWQSSHDGRPVQGWLVYPPGYDPAKRYPLLLEIHGGPFANYGPRFAPEIQMYASKGYLVLYANPRGSTSYGAEFANLIHHNYPGQDFDDLMSGVDAVIARGIVDQDNLFVTGGSGGGTLTAWIVGHTDRFRAAVVAKPVINWYSFVLTADAYGYFSQYWFPGPPWEHAEHYLKRSPISYVGKVSTPTMLITGEADYRTPMSETEQYYQALKLRKIDTALVRIPGASHSINRRPSQMIAQVLNTSGWFEKHRAPAGKQAEATAAR
ncbi:S9 family peptidase [Pseudomarimonas salicorniae]|uniref:S9 family peptidase n=1 Tax=Pseudomarimonas salicorniae TaxID=2933270 RepID=A0ABT0GJE7_9GAMM|nr:S9 family peptidase [Lysobacter sp. CAU 1642]MCK7594666.1 S9 family peptidase [Lysobacter sp. CAU 1642]